MTCHMAVLIWKILEYIIYKISKFHKRTSSIDTSHLLLMLCKRRAHGSTKKIGWSMVCKCIKPFPEQILLLFTLPSHISLVSNQF